MRRDGVIWIRNFHHLEETERGIWEKTNILVSQENSLYSQKQIFHKTSKHFTLYFVNHLQYCTVMCRFVTSTISTGTGTGLHTVPGSVLLEKPENYPAWSRLFLESHSSVERQC